MVWRGVERLTARGVFGFASLPLSAEPLVQTVKGASVELLIPGCRVMGRSRILLAVEAYEQVLRLGRPICHPGKFCAPAHRPSRTHIAFGVEQAAAAGGCRIAEVVIANFAITECYAAGAV